MAHHADFSMVTTVTMRCDYCNSRNDRANHCLQKCNDCNLQVCRSCIDKDVLKKDEKHRMDAEAIRGLKWSQDGGSIKRRPARRIVPREPASPSVLPQQHQWTQLNIPLRPQDPRVLHQSAAQGQFQNGQPHALYPPGLAFPPDINTMMPRQAVSLGGLPSGPGQYGQFPGYGAMAMPLASMRGQHYNAPPGSYQNAGSAFQMPSGQPHAQNMSPALGNFGPASGFNPYAFNPALMPQGFGDPRFSQLPFQQQPMPGQTYDNMWYVPDGNWPSGQLVPSPQHPHAQPHGGGAFAHAPPSEGESRPRERKSGPAQGGHVSRPVEQVQEARVRVPTAQGHVEQPLGSLDEQQLRQGFAQPQPQTHQALQQPSQQVMQQNMQPVMHQQRGQLQRVSQVAQQPQQQMQQQSREQHGRPATEAGAVSGPPPITASSAREPQPPVSSAPAARQAAPEPETASQPPQLERGEHNISPTVVSHAHSPFGIPALARDMAARRPSHYDETAERWARSPSVHARQQRQPGQNDDDGDGDGDDDYDDGDGDGGSTGASTGGPAHPPRAAQSTPRWYHRGYSRGQKRRASRESSLSPELDRARAGPTAPVPGTGALRRELRDNPEIAGARREGGEQAALAMAAAANTLQGGGRGLLGAADAQVVANDEEILRRQQEVAGRHLRRDEEKQGRGAKRQKKNEYSGGGGSGYGSGSGYEPRDGGSRRYGSGGGSSGGVGV
ncbi:hypothetical protein diail_6476 [Diaporthe ilicicola]|nr:hypothetical protein diail_6476 [Diaporthe ilicicola]